MAVKKKTATKRKPAKTKVAKRKVATRGASAQATLTCPECNSKQKMKVPKSQCSMKSCECKGCGKKLKSPSSCIFCEYTNKPCKCHN